MKTFRDMMIGAVMTFVAMFAASAVATINLPAVNGPSLGDYNANIYTLTQAITNANQMSFTPTLSASQTTTQAGCSQMTTTMLNVSTSAGTGSVCLPTAFAGREIYINNPTGSTIDLFGSATTAVAGTQDTINGTTGTTAYTGLTTGKTTTCFSPANGTWACASGS